MDTVQDIGIQSYCFRAFKDNEKVANMVKQCGLSKIELCGTHADFTDESNFDKLISLYKNAGVDIVSIGVQSFKNDEAAENLFFEFAKKAGAKVISADFVLASIPESFRTAEKLADRYDINIAIHNHGGRHWLGTSTMLEDVFSKTSKRIGLCLDTAWALDSGEDPIAMAQTFSDRIYCVHIKDFVFDRARKPEDVIVGQGNLELKKLLEILRELHFNGAAALEYEGDVENPVPALKQCVSAIRVLRN